MTEHTILYEKVKIKYGLLLPTQITLNIKPLAKRMKKSSSQQEKNMDEYIDVL